MAYGTSKSNAIKFFKVGINFSIFIELIKCIQHPDPQIALHRLT